MRNFIPFFILIMLATTISAQNQDTSYSFSVKQAVDFALQNQKEVVNAELDTKIAHYKVKETVGIGLPQISGSFDVKDYLKIPTLFVPDFVSPTVYNILYDENLIQNQKQPSDQLYAAQFGAQWNATAGINATQLLFDPAYLLGVKASKAFRELSEKNYQRTKIETATSVTKAYYFVLVSREGKKVIEANATRLKKLLNDTKALYDNGFVEKLDVERVQVTYNNVVTESENFDRLIELSEKALKFQIGLSPNANVTTTDTMNVETVKALDAVVDKVDPSKRVEYSILKQQETLQTYNLKRYKGQYLPTLAAYGSLSTQATRPEFNIFNSEKWYPTSFIGATLSLNIFDGTQRENKINQEKLALRKIGNQMSNFENSVVLEVNSSRLTLLNAISALNNQTENLGLAESIVKTTKLKYDQGVGSNIEVIDAESALKEAQVNYYRALYNAIIAKIDLEKSLGNLSY